MSGTPHVEARAVTRTYPGRGSGAVHALRECSLAVPRGTFQTIYGPSGCGKTTLLRLLAALDRPTSGDVLHDGRSLAALSEAELSTLRRGIGLVFQGDLMLPRLPVWENVAYPLIPRGVRRGDRRAAALAALERVGIAHVASKRPEELSGGELQRVGVARAVVTRPALIVADEPAAHLDDASASAVIELLTDLRDGGTTIVVATHRRDLVAAADGALDLTARAGRRPPADAAEPPT